MEEGGLRSSGGPEETPPSGEPVAVPPAALLMPDLMDDDLDAEEPKPAAAKQPEAKPVEEPAQPAKVRETAAERRDRAALEAELRATREEVEYWRKNGAAKPAAEAKTASTPDMSTDEMINMFVTDPKALFQKLNLVTADQAERIADEKAEAKAMELMKRTEDARRQEAAILGEFGDLAKPDSELFKRTTQILEEYTGGDKSKLSDPTLLKLAARAAKAELGGRANDSREKQLRIAAQGPVGRRVDGDSAPSLSNEARAFAAKMGIKDMSGVARQAARMKGSLI
jgi:hypothetical protein